MEVTFSLAQDDKQWVIQDIRYNESGAPVIPACADCGTVLPPEARFCPSCGSEIDGAEVAPGDSAGGDA